MRALRCAVTTLVASALLFAALAYTFLSSGGLSARRKPTDFEYWVANHAMELSIPTALKARTNPFILTNERILQARKFYSDNCAICHANDGTGKTRIAGGLSPEVPDLHAEHVQKLSDGEMFYIIKNGVRFTGMPGWDLGDDEIWNLVLFVRQFGKETKPQ